MSDQAISAIPVEPPHADAPAKASRAVLVLGMHRSGTSALARVLNLLGVQLGSNLLPPAADNEMGFWEHREVQSIHDRLLRTLRRGWNSVSPMPADWQHQPQMAGFADEVRAVVQRDFGPNPLWGLKDPRLCCTLPLWRESLPAVEVHCAFIVRNPAEVVRSLAKRDQMPPMRGYMLWLRSLIAAERDSRGLRRSMTRYDALMHDWRPQVDRISSDLSIAWPTPPEQAAAEIGQFLRPSLRHHQIEDQRFMNDPAVPHVVRRAYAAALAACESGAFAPLSAELEQIAGELDDPEGPWTAFVAEVESEHFMLAIRAHEESLERIEALRQAYQQTSDARTTALEQSQRAQTLEQELQRVSQHAGGLEELNQNLQARLRMSEQHAAELQQHATNLQAHADGLQQQSTGLQQQIAQLEPVLENLRARLEMSEEHARQLRQHADGLERIGNERAAAFEQQIESLRAEIAAGHERLKEATQQHEVLADLLRQTWASRSWRWTAALRGTGGAGYSRRELVPISEMVSLGDFTWKASGTPRFLLPCKAVQGGIAVRLRLNSSSAAQAHLYFDTGRFFNDQQRIDLGMIGGASGVAAEVKTSLPEPVFCFRLDLQQVAGEFTIETFELSAAAGAA